MLAGQVLRATVIGFAYIVRGGRDSRPWARDLVQRGFFAHSRNPLYVGNLVWLVGLAVFHNAPWCYAGTAFFFIAYKAIVAAEEEFLLERFGAEYRDYCRRVPRWIPRLRGLGATLAEMRFDWRRLVRKEYNTTAAGLLWLGALWVWDDTRYLGASGARWELPIVAAFSAAVVLLYAVARFLKKSGALGAD